MNSKVNKLITEQEAKDLGLKAKGDCYSRAVTNLFKASVYEYFEVFLCHGTARSTNSHPALTGRPFHHAWVEVRRSADGPMVCLDGITMPDIEQAELRSRLIDEGAEAEAIDYLVASVAEQEVLLEKEVYYATGQIDPDSVQRYTRAETLRKLATHLHYGPWEDLPPANLN